MELLKEIGEKVGADLTKEIELAEQKFNNKIERVINDMTNDNIHKINE
jgi:polyhydroxyalkanoate synthesis regulator phasin